MISSEKLSKIRSTLLGVTGATCLIYAVMSLLLGRPDPMPFWIPGILGFGSAALIAVAAIFAGQKNAEQATDEGYLTDRRRAESYAYWIALLLYPAFAVPIAKGWLGWPTAFAAMGTITGATFLLLFVWFDTRGRS